MKKIEDPFRSDCQRDGMIEASDDVIKEAQNLIFRTTTKTSDAILLASYKQNFDKNEGKNLKIQ